MIQYKYCIVLAYYIYISLLPRWFGDLHTCYKSNEQQWKESKNETKKEQQTKIHEQTKTGIKDTNWKKKVIKWKLGIVKHKLTSVYAYLPHNVYNNS